MLMLKAGKAAGRAQEGYRKFIGFTIDDCEFMIGFTIMGIAHGNIMLANYTGFEILIRVSSTRWLNDHIESNCTMIMVMNKCLSTSIVSAL